MEKPASALTTMLFMLAGPIIWAAHFLVVYGAHASLCEAGARLPLVDAAALPWLLGGATLLALAALAATIWMPRPLACMRALRTVPEDGSFILTVTRLLAFLSFVGVFGAGMAIVILPLCDQLR